MYKLENKEFVFVVGSEAVRVDLGNRLGKRGKGTEACEQCGGKQRQCGVGEWERDPAGRERREKGGPAGRQKGPVSFRRTAGQGSCVHSLEL